MPNEETAERKSPRFKRSRTQSCMLPPSKEAVSFAARKRASNSISEQHDNRQLNPQAKEFVMNREVNICLMGPDISQITIITNFS